MKKRYLITLTILILVITFIFLQKNDKEKFVYQRYDNTLKCLPESFKITEINYEGLISDKGFKYWKVSMSNLKNNSLYEGYMVSTDESGLVMGNNVLLATHCIEERLPENDTNNDSKNNVIYQVFLYSQNNRQIEKKKAIISDKYIWVNP